MNFENTQPAMLDGEQGLERLAEFRVGNAREVLALLRQVRDGSVPVLLSGPDGSMVNASLWSIDSTQERLHFSVGGSTQPQLQRLIDDDEAVAVAYLDSVKLQFDISGLLLVRGANTATLQARLPPMLYRFQRRGSYRVRPVERAAPMARLRHPSIPDMLLALRVVDVSIGGCALLLPHDVPPLAPGVRLSDVQFDLDADTRFGATILLHHVTSIPASEHGVRLGCEFQSLAAAAQRSMQRYVDQTQKRRRLLSLD